MRAFCVQMAITNKGLDAPFEEIFYRVGLSNLSTILNQILLGRSLLVHCENRELLVLFFETLLFLIHPLEWVGIYIPFLPKRLLDYLNGKRFHNAA
jgi:hypothetical protein